MGHDWAGYTFLALDRHDARFVKLPGLYAFVRRCDQDRILLFAGEADCIAAVVEPTHPQWAAATVLGMNELHVFLTPRDRLERLLVLDRVVRRCDPLLNVLQMEGASGGPKVRTAAGRQA